MGCEGKCVYTAGPLEAWPSENKVSFILRRFLVVLWRKNFISVLTCFPNIYYVIGAKFLRVLKILVAIFK